MKNFMIKYSRLRFLTLLAFVVAVCAIAIAGCVETKDEFTVNPDGSGKIVHELTFPSMDLGPGSEMGSEGASFDITGGEPSGPQAQLKKSVKEILSQSSGVDTWKDVSYKMTDDGRSYFKGTAYFPNINNLSLHNAGFSSDMKLNFTRDISGEITIELKSEEQAEEGKAVKPPTTELSEAELDEDVKDAKLRYNQTKPMMQDILSGLKSETILHLPADIKEISNFEKVNARTVRIAFEGSKMIEVMDKMMQDEAWLKEQIRAGKDPLRDGPESGLAMNEMLFGEKAPVRIVVAQGAQQLFDYDAEVTAARANYENMLKELGLKGAEPTRPTRTQKAVAENGNEDAKQKEVLTNLEQRMLKTISIDFRNTPIEDVIRIMAEQADVDIVKSPTVIGNVTATLTSVPLAEALDNILTAHGYAYIAGENMIRVAPVAEITEKAERLTSRIYRITYADVKEVEKALQRFISNRGSISSNPGTSNIIVTDTETKIKVVDTFIDEIDRITPQILVEARIYDVTSTEGFDIGAEWDAGRNNPIAVLTDVITKTTDANGIATTTRVETDTRNTAWQTSDAGVTADTEDYSYRKSKPFVGGSFDADTAGTIRLGLLDTVNVDIALNILRTEVGAKLLANPRILVLDNETAEFKIISEIPYTEQSTTSEGGSMTSTKFKEVGVELQVTPHVTREGMIRLHIMPTFSVISELGSIVPGTGSRTVPTIDSREVDTKALVKDGQTVVLGGLRKREVSQEISKIPFLGDVPLLGALFTEVSESVETNELIIFITPRIVIEPVLSPGELNGLEATEFPGPKITYTEDEKTERAKK